MAFIVEARNIDALWYKTYKAIREEGTKVSGIQEIPNLIMVLTGKFAPSKFFDKSFRQCFGDERIDYASSVTFVPPEKGLTGYSYPQNNCYRQRAFGDPAGGGKPGNYHARH